MPGEGTMFTLWFPLTAGPEAGRADDARSSDRRTLPGVGSAPVASLAGGQSVGLGLGAVAEVGVERGERQVQRGGIAGPKTRARSKAAAAAAGLPVAASARPRAAWISGSAGSMKIAIGASSRTRSSGPPSPSPARLLWRPRPSADRGGDRHRALPGDPPSDAAFRRAPRAARAA